jgi:glycerophosphoryl diester phosphodiesterase
MMLRRMKLLAPALQTMPTFRAMRTPEEIAAIASNLHPFAINIGRREASAEAVDAAHDLGALAFVDVMRMDTPEGWSTALEWGADGLQTDRPSALLAFLRERNLHP